MSEQPNPYEEAYSEEGLRDKLGRYAKTAGREVVEKALLLYYAAQQDDTPRWAKATIIGALGYFIAPLDAIVDLTPGIGYADDLGVLALALATVASQVNDDVRQRTQARLTQWFGGEQPSPEGGDADKEKE
ncbi:DUF1232 domain-containing protein [Mangrovimicrobium sediminis]|uniref:DUF1232 domain-containing protein n=1 Tax=Mangrovimicrobium sediminis TaxID=2562682 RepID=A0A4Z0M6Y0_9GAMM|nr:YkvA family protein [Haliea sp. SAOS-164]TGD75170.1 DUF1232 domain-containing protein [Haliea sp. SAOS-164]